MPYMPMKRLLLLIALCLTVGCARASVFSIESAPFNDGHSYIGGYHSLLDGNEVISFCIDYGHNVGFHQSYEVTAISLSDYQGPLRTNYLEAGYLILLLTGITDVDAISNIQRAIWLITTPGTSDPYLTTSPSFAYATQATLNYQSVDASNFTLILRDGVAGQSQLVVGQVPEASTFAFCAIGLVALIGLRRFK